MVSEEGGAEAVIIALCSGSSAAGGGQLEEDVVRVGRRIEMSSSPPGLFSRCTPPQIISLCAHGDRHLSGRPPSSSGRCEATFPQRPIAA